MKHVTLESLIAMLHAFPKTEKEAGWNSALITLLKEEPHVSSHPLSNLNIPSEIIREIDEMTRNGNKLMCVKRIKEYSTLGLREAKDAFDEYYATEAWK